jgi:hypothetical protein
LGTCQNGLVDEAFEHFGEDGNDVNSHFMKFYGQKYAFIAEFVLILIRKKK